MKTLILVRHGKSSWEYDLPDIDRPLKKRGITDAKLVSKHFRSMNYTVDKLFSSPANRAISICRIFIEKLGFEDDIVEIIPNLYDFGGDKVLKFIKTIDNKYNTVMLFGHNHAFTHLVNLLGSDYIDNLPTTGMAIIRFEIDDWSKVSDNGTTLEIITPKQLKN